MVSETKPYSSFPESQFIIEGCSHPCRYDRNSNGGGIFLFVREDVPTKKIKRSPLKDFEGIFLDLSLNKKKTFLCCSYDPHKVNISNNLHIIGKPWISKWQCMKISLLLAISIETLINLLYRLYPNKHCLSRLPNHKPISIN